MNPANAFALYAFCMPFAPCHGGLRGLFLAPWRAMVSLALAPRLDMAEAKGAQMVKHKSIFSHVKTQ